MQSRGVGVVEGEEEEEEEEGEAEAGEDEKEIGIISTTNSAENQGKAGATIAIKQLGLPPSPICRHIHEESSRLFLSSHSRSRSSSCCSLTVRSTNAKDRHSKVRTSKGLRDRRVRLSAPTAIQFFEIQDRLGFDQPSKAVDWLIQHARSAIDELSPIAIAIAEPQKKEQEQEQEKQKQKPKQKQKEQELLPPASASASAAPFYGPSSAGIARRLSRHISDDANDPDPDRSPSSTQIFSLNPNRHAAQSQSPDSAPLPQNCIHLHSSKSNPNRNVSQSQSQSQVGSLLLDGVARRAMARERARERVILRGKSRMSSHMKRSAEEMDPRKDQAAEVAPSPPWKKVSTSAAVLLPMPSPSPSPSPQTQTQTPPAKQLQVLSELLLQSSSSSKSQQVRMPPSPTVPSSSTDPCDLMNPRMPRPVPHAQFCTEAAVSFARVSCTTASHGVEPDAGCTPPSPPKFKHNSDHSPRGTLQSINLCNFSTIASTTSTDSAITAADRSYLQFYHRHHHHHHHNNLLQPPPSPSPSSSPFLHHHRHHHIDYHQQQMQLMQNQNQTNAPSLLMMQRSETTTPDSSSLSPAPPNLNQFNSLYMHHQADQLGLGRHSHHHCILPPSDALSRPRNSAAGLIYLMQDQFLPKPDN